MALWPASFGWLEFNNTIPDGRAPHNQGILRWALLTDKELVEDVFGGSRQYNITGILRTWKYFIPQRHGEDLRCWWPVCS